MNHPLSFFLLSLTSFFTLINPLGVMPIFLTMTSGLQAEDRRFTARRAVLAAFVILLVFALTGHLLFEFFGISIDSLKIVGGVIFFLMGQDMLQARLGTTKITDREVRKYTQDISITPLAIPMISGPGAITNAIVLMDNSQGYVEKLLLLVAIGIVSALTYIIIANADKLMKFIGETGNNVLMRIMGLIVMVIAVQFFISGMTPIVRNMLHIH